MKKRRTNLSFKTAGGVCIFLALLFSGCADDKKPAPASGQSAHAAMAKSTQTGIPVATAQIRKSVFVLDQASRDPFFPQAKKAVENSPAAVAQVTPMDIPTLLSAGLQGIGGTREHRIAIIYNILLEPGRKVVIPVRVGNQSRSVSVRCREIAKNSVVLEVEGYGPLIVKAKETL